jgi:hypothetical protein
MIKRPALYVVASPLHGNVVPIRCGAAARDRASVVSLRETSWRNLVRQLSNFPVKG